jgi:acyl-CoA synthetase (AMP-forming)/AMP-acid ligase II
MPAGAPAAPDLIRLCDFVAHYARVHPAREALVWNDLRWSYRAFADAVERCAAGLAAAGVGAGDRVAMLTTPRPEFAIVLMACLQRGAIWVGLNPRHQLAELRHVVEDCRPAMLISLVAGPDGRDYRSDLRALAHTVGRVVTFPEALPGVATSLELLEIDPTAVTTAGSPGSADAPAVIVYTSGTTGKPKGALLSHRNLLFSYRSVSRSFAGKEYLRDGLRVLCNLPPNHIGGLSEILGNCIIRGGTAIFSERFDPSDVLRTIEKEGVTLLGGVPLMLQRIFDHGSFARTDLSSLKLIGWGGAPAPRTLIDRMASLGAHLFTNYGLTEGGAVISATPPDYTIDVLADTVGAPFDVYENRIVDEQGLDVPVGQSGEIRLKGDGVFLGYWNNPEATAAAFDSGGWLKTGDMAQKDADGNWLLRGRTTEMFKSGGYNIYPREIEMALEEHPAVVMAAVVAVPDALYFELGHAFVALIPGLSVDGPYLRAFLRARLANYKIPKTVTVLEALPMLPIGKVDRAALKALAAHHGGT